MKALIIFILAAGICAVLISLFRSGHPVRQALKTLFQGIVSLAAVNVAGLVTGIALSINKFTLIFVSVFGMPGTILLTVMKFIFR